MQKAIIRQWSIHDLQILKEYGWKLNNLPDILRLPQPSTERIKSRRALTYSLLVLSAWVLAACGGIDSPTQASMPIIQTELTKAPTVEVADLVETLEPALPPLPAHILSMDIDGIQFLLDEFGEPEPIEFGIPSFETSYRYPRNDSDHPEESEIFNEQTPINIDTIDSPPFSGYEIVIGPHQVDSERLISQSWEFAANSVGSLLDRTLTGSHGGSARMDLESGRLYIDQLAQRMDANNTITIHSAKSQMGDGGGGMVIVPPTSPGIDMNTKLSVEMIRQLLQTPTAIDNSMNPAIAMFNHMAPYQPAQVEMQLQPNNLIMSDQSGGIVYFSPETRQIMIGVNIIGASNLLPDQDKYQNDDVIVQAALVNEFTNVIVELLNENPELQTAMFAQLAEELGSNPDELLQRAIKIIDETVINSSDPNAVEQLKNVQRERIKMNLFDEITSSVIMLQYLDTIP